MSKNISDRLTENAEKIMQLWEERAYREVQASSNYGSLVLRNSLKDQLIQISKLLADDNIKNSIQFRENIVESNRLGKLHGIDRALKSSYSIDQVIFEFHIFRQVICDVLSEQHSLSDLDREIITSAIELAVNNAASEFSSTLTNIQDEIVHAMAHDLRGPITAAKLVTQQLLRKLNEDANVSKMLNQVIKNMNRLDLMIKELLDTAKLKSGSKIPLQFEESDLNVIVENIVTELNFIYSHRFKFISSGPCPGLWSEIGIQRLIENLATNAIKYGEQNTPISISLDNVEDAFILKIHNHGKAIPPEDQANLFKKFQRANGNIHKSGWGIGLTIVEAMARAHHGVIQVDSIEEKGTTFTIKFLKNSK